MKLQLDPLPARLFMHHEINVFLESFFLNLIATLQNPVSKTLVLALI
ncbi:MULTISPECIES: hypothetical protein [Peribacillus]|nr:MULTISPECIES: hypothetical protein [Peribacillus]MCM3675093.1 hypothetical protein [Peribacillus simplex]MDQ0884169.1 hypothetical protein [Peribacillus sp. V2I11]